MFVHNVFNRLFIIDDTLKTARQLIAKYEQDPNSIRIRHTYRRRPKTSSSSRGSPVPAAVAGAGHLHLRRAHG